MSGWCYQDRSGRIVGPMSGGALKKLAEYGEIVPETPVCKAGHSTWVPARRVKGLGFAAVAPRSRATDEPLQDGNGSNRHRVRVMQWGAIGASLCVFFASLIVILVNRSEKVVSVETTIASEASPPVPLEPKTVEQDSDPDPEPEPAIPVDKPDNRVSDQAPPPPENAQATDLVRTIEPSLVVVKTPLGRGSGFVLGKGLIATNFHVIAGAKQATVQAVDGTEFVVNHCVAFSLEADLAVLSADLPENYASLELQLEFPAKGERVFAFGCPAGFDFSVSEGIVSAVRQVHTTNLIQTTAPVSKGSSGGPLVGPHGKVVGVTALKILSGESLNFAIAAVHLHDLLRDKRDEGVPLAALPQLPQDHQGEPEPAEVPHKPAADQSEALQSAIAAEQRLQLAEQLALVDQERILLFKQRDEVNQKLASLRQQAATLATEYRVLAQKANSVGIAATAVGTEAANIQQRLMFETDTATRGLLFARLQELGVQDAALTRELALLNAQAEQVKQAAAVTQAAIAATTYELQSLYVRADQLRLEFLRVLDPWGKSQTGNYDAAIQALNEWIVREADHPDAYAIRAFLNFWADHPDLATSDAATALRLSPKSWLSLAAAGYSDLWHGKTKTALTKLNQAVTNAPWCPYAYFIRGVAHLRNRTFGNAFADLKKAVELLPEDAAIHIQLAQVYAACPADSRRNADKAREHAETALKLIGEQKWAALDALAMAQAEAGDFIAAQRTVQEAIELAPSRMKPVYQSRLAAYMDEKPWRLQLD